MLSTHYQSCSPWHTLNAVFAAHDTTQLLTPPKREYGGNEPSCLPCVTEMLSLLQEPIFQKFEIEAGNLMRGLVSCTGAQFCGIAMIETKNRAMAIVAKLEEQLDLPKKVRMHWTGCPNSCGQAQVGDIGLMGGPAKLDGKAVEGVRIMVRTSSISALRGRAMVQSCSKRMVHNSTSDHFRCW